MRFPNRTINVNLAVLRSVAQTKRLCYNTYKNSLSVGFRCALPLCVYLVGLQPRWVRFPNRTGIMRVLLAVVPVFFQLCLEDTGIRGY